jgi:hypothetical protein
MKIRQLVLLFFLPCVVLLSGFPAQAQDAGLPKDKVALRYRIEILDGEKWKPVEGTKKFKMKQTIRFRFMSNVAGTLYVLNNSDEMASLEPVFSKGTGEGLRRFLGPGTHIEADHVGVFPDPTTGGGLRFTGIKGMERFLFVFIPDDVEGRREMMAIPTGAETWDFEAKTTYMTTGPPGQLLFHFFELKSK